MPRFLYIPVLVLYGWLTIAYLVPTWLGDRGRRYARRVTVGAVGVHSAVFAVSLLVPHSAVGFSEGLSATSLGLMVAFLWVGTGRVRSVGMVASPLSLALLGVALVVPPRGVQALEQTGYSLWLPVHLTLIFSGIAGFGLACLVGMLYLWARDRLKKKRLEGIRHLPSLEVLDRIQFRAMLFGFVFLTLGIGAGGAWASASLQGGWTVDPKVWVTLLIWLWYGLGLQLRLTLGQRGRWTALFSITGFVGLLGSLVGVNLLISSWHGYGG